MNWNLPNVTIGILGGGQLARMTIHAASRMGFKVAIMEGEADSPAAQLSRFEVVGKWSDMTALRKLTDYSDVITLENEFVEAHYLEQLESWGKPVYPTSKTLALVQDKARQKQTMAGEGLPVPVF